MQAFISHEMPAPFNDTLPDLPELMSQSVESFVSGLKQSSPRLSHQVFHELNKPPAVFIRAEAADPSAKGVLMYGHLEQELSNEQWWKSGHPVFSALKVVEDLQASGVPHRPIMMLVEFCDKSKSNSSFYMEKLKSEIGEPESIYLDNGP